MSVASLCALEEVAKTEWTRVEVAEPVVRAGSTRLRTNEVLIRGAIDVAITVLPRDVAARFEVFPLNVRRWCDTSTPERRFQSRHADSGELFAAFLGGVHQLLVVSRRHAIPEWADPVAREVLVEDLIIFRHVSGQQAYIASDEEEPGALIVTRTRDQIPFPNAEPCVFRVL